MLHFSQLITGISRHFYPFFTKNCYNSPINSNVCPHKARRGAQVIDSILKSLLDKTWDALEHFYQRDYPSLLEFLHPDITWIDTALNKRLHGLSQVASSLHTLDFAEATLSQRCFSGLSGEDQFILTGQYTARPLHRLLPPTRLLATVIWKPWQAQWKIWYLHMSACAIYLNSNTAKAKRLVITNKKGREYFIPHQNIMYIEAFNMECQIHCLDSIISANSGLSEIQNKLSSPFLRIHRSYLVNSSYVAYLERYSVSLYNGTRLPIPEKKYKDIRRRLLEDPME